MIFLPAIEKLLQEAFADPKFQELQDALDNRKGHINLTGMTETQKAYLIAAGVLYRVRQEKSDKTPIPVILVSDELRARQLKSSLDAFFEQECVVLRGRETQLSAVSASSREIERGRVNALVRYGNRQCGALIVTAGGLLTRMLPGEKFYASHIDLKLGKRLPPEDLAMSLISLGYYRTREVGAVGEFSRRGDIFDIFPSGSDKGLRISYFDDEIDQIKYFDLQSQRSEEKFQSVTIYPASELLLSKKSWEGLSYQMNRICDQAARKAAAAGASRNSIDNMTRMQQDAGRNEPDPGPGRTAGHHDRS